ncbi:AbrB/MazE/SpoVT family DNA-binding domain-containing protein [Acidianus sulfidivorans JP7]|uniref:AbrB family transcriptional regulator n=2 Tax=Acidianus TaxID=12914 RepID=A0A2U9IQX0_9CREN|nr:AbrB/MazE/SpoVT family DNA-binding domain-containing protein [Acidianus sulfidivorans]AWR98357.1 AbrB/MazE/SpoVT family DNA-binding domain-containing protein [Acidianus sulfidivorans JP7]
MKEGKLTEVTVRVIKNHTINIPVEIAQRLHIKEGDFVKVVYDEKENAIKIFPYK